MQTTCVYIYKTLKAPSKNCQKILVQLKGKKSIYKSLLDFQILTTTEKLRKQFHSQLHQKNKVPKNKLNQKGERPIH